MNGLEPGHGEVRARRGTPAHAAAVSTSIFERLATIAADREQSAEARIGGILQLIADGLDLGLAFLARVEGETLHIERAYDRASMDLREGAAIPLCDTYCQAMLADEAGSLVVEDAAADPRFATIATTRELGIGSYSGVPLHRADGSVYGTLCTLHPHARALQDGEVGLLRLAGRLVMQAIEAGELREREARFRALTESATDAIIAADAQGRILSWNGGATCLFGYTTEEAVGQPVTMLMPEQYRAAHEQGLHRLAAGGAPRVLGHTVELVGRRKDGAAFPIELSLSSWTSGEGHFYSGIIRDVSVRATMEKALRASEERFRLLFDAAPTGIALATPDGHLLEVNQALCAMLGYSVPELLEQGTPLLTHPDDLVESRALIDRLLSGESQSAALEKRYLHRAGHVIWTHYTATLLRDEAGQPLYFIFHLQDITARKQVEEARARLAAIVEASDDAIFGKTLDGIITAWNGGAERLYGYNPAEIIGQSVARLIPPDRPRELAALMQAVACGETVRQYETERVRKDGTRLAVALTIAPIRDNERAVVSASVVARDITARKEAEAELRASEERYRQVQEHAPIGLALVAPDGRWLRVNPALCTLVGYSEDELLARTFQDITYPDDLEADLAYVRQMLIGEIMTYQMEKRYIRKDGSIVWILLSVSLVRDEAGQPLYFISQIQDIDARKRAEEALRASEERFRALIAYAPVGTAVADERGVLELVNDAFAITYGYAPAEMMGQSITMLVPAEGRPALAVAYADYVARGAEVRDEYSVVTRSGERRTVLGHSVQMTGPDGRPRRATFSTDITERACLEAELRASHTALERTNRELARSNAELEQFSRVASHDLRSPLHTIGGFAQILQMRYKGRLDADADEYIDFITSGVARMQALIDALLSYARLDSRARLHAPVDCAALARDALANLHAALEDA